VVSPDHGDNSYPWANPPFSTIATDPEDDALVALHELGHGAWGLADEYRFHIFPPPVCTNGTPYSLRISSIVDPSFVPNLWGTVGDCQADRLAYGFVSDCHEFVQYSTPEGDRSLFRLGNAENPNLMRYKCENHGNLVTNGYGEAGTLRMLQVVGVASVGSAPAQSAGSSAHRTAHVSVVVNEGTWSVGDISIARGTPIPTAPAVGGLSLELLDHDDAIVARRLVWDPRFQSIHDSLQSTEPVNAELIIEHGLAHRWRLLDRDGTMLIGGSLGCAFLEYSRQINFTDEDNFISDADGDSIPDVFDNCPAVFNPDQGDMDGNGTGDACEAPVPVTLVSFSAQRVASTAVLRWTVSRPLAGHVGFRVFRETAGGGRHDISEDVLSHQEVYEFVDGAPPNGETQYWLKEVTSGRDGEYWYGPATLPPSAAVPFSLSPIYPNPFNPETSIQFSIPNRGEVELAVFDTKGRLVRRLIRATRAGGNYTERWDGRDVNGETVASGVYFVRLVWSGRSQSQKVVLLR
ncbi:MAG: T9SS type A sorting domain-containing protein, partial [Rubricoccaceae bacterium]|nr:T9SS type A sorting domain-containing protein [Rubricoccaceae bacterium]